MNERLLAAAALAIGVACASRAYAESSSSALSWVRLPGAESCIATAELGERIERHLGRSVLVSPSVADISIEGRVARQSKQFKATIGGAKRDGTPMGTRELVSTTGSCRELDDALVLAIALMIDPDALAPKPKEETEAAPAPPPVTREVIHERTVIHEVERVPATSPPWILEGMIYGAASLERLPGVGLAVGGALRFGPHRLAAVEVSFGGMPSQSLDVDRRSVDFSLYEGGIAYAPSFALGSRFEAGGVVGLRAGAIHSSGSRFASNGDVDRGLADIAAGARLRFAVAGPLFLSTSATALVPLVRQETTVVDGANVIVVHRRSAVGADFGLGVGISFSP